MTAARAARQTAITVPWPVSEVHAAATISWVCRPISRNTAFSSRNCRVCQLIRAERRASAVCSRWARCPSTIPATTTASTPEPCRSSVRAYAVNGTRNDRPTVIAAFCSRRKNSPASRATPRPIATASTTARPKSSATAPAERAAVRASVAERRLTRAVASLTRDSPSRMVTTRRGRPTWRATAVAATASGGATTAPIANAAAHGTPSIGRTTRATPTMVNNTSPIDSQPIEVMLDLKSASGVLTAAA
ncbi:hypothetical protein SDC9_142704 [bioreactor metagenome]|uniref:Uncharacterized protein n=1 Tax=bioreactor metagenome TaxID=1076179 RepID=A0A645E1X0_9ZZZZ